VGPCLSAGFWWPLTIPGDPGIGDTATPLSCISLPAYLSTLSSSHDTSCWIGDPPHLVWPDLNLASRICRDPISR